MSGSRKALGRQESENGKVYLWFFYKGIGMLFLAVVIIFVAIWRAKEKSEGLAELWPLYVLASFRKMKSCNSWSLQLRDDAVDFFGSSWFYLRTYT